MAGPVAPRRQQRSAPGRAPDYSLGVARAKPAAVKTERLLNLVIALLYTRQPMTKARIRQAVPQYQDSTDEAFDRMFERDKDELRELGIPLRTEGADAFFDDEPGYRIDKREYALPETEFAPDELAVIGLASRAWSQASLAGPAARAMAKLEAAGLARDEGSVAGIEPLVHTTEPSFDDVRGAVLARRPIRFDYRGSGRAATTAREVQPWSLTSWHGRWYVVGLDLGRGAARVFRLDRIEGKVSADRKATPYEVPEHDARAMITASSQAGEPVTARVALEPGAGQSLRRWGTAAGTLDGWDVVEIVSVQPWGLVEQVASLGTQARVLEPADLAERVRRQMERVVAAHEAADAEGPSS